MHYFASNVVSIGTCTLGIQRLSTEYVARALQCAYIPPDVRTAHLSVSGSRQDCDFQVIRHRHGDDHVHYQHVLSCRLLPKFGLMQMHFDHGGVTE